MFEPASLIVAKPAPPNPPSPGIAPLDLPPAAAVAGAPAEEAAVPDAAVPDVVVLALDAAVPSEAPAFAVPSVPRCSRLKTAGREKRMETRSVET